MASIAGVSIAGPKVFARASESSTPQAVNFPRLNSPWRRSGARRMYVRPAAVPPDTDRLSEKVVESIKNAQEACNENPVSGECAAAWDEVEELSAAASHAKDKKKDSDPLETYCKDNPEVDECRTYDN